MKTTESKQFDISAEKTDNKNSGINTELKRSTEIPNTPFRAVWYEETGWFAVCGKYRISDTYEILDELISEIHQKKWDTIIALINIAIIENSNNNNEQKN